MWLKLGATFAVVVAVLLLGACGSSQESDESPLEESQGAVASAPVAETSPPSDHVWAEASWPMAYGDIPSLQADADLVVLGEIIDSSLGSIGTQVGAIHVTEFSFKVEKLLQGNVPQSNTIVVVQTGGMVGDKIVEIRDDPLMAVGDRYVLFLRKATSGRYVILGPAGRFVVQDGLVSSLSVVHPELEISDVGIADMPLDALVQEVARQSDDGQGGTAPDEKSP